MPAIYFIEPALQLLYFAGYGSCTGTDYIEINREAAADPRRTPDLRTIIDMRRLNEFVISMDEMKDIAAMDRAFVQAGVYGSNLDTALVVRHDMDETIGRLYNLTVQEECLGVEIFYSLGEALHWFDLAASRTSIEGLLEQALAGNQFAALPVSSESQHQTDVR